MEERDLTMFTDKFSVAVNDNTEYLFFALATNIQFGLSNHVWSEIVAIEPSAQYMAALS